MSSCLISDVKYDDRSIRPIILKFENGTLQSDQENNVSCCLYKDSHNKFLIATATEQALYGGSVDQDELYNNFIAVHNKKKNKVRLIAVDYARLSPLLQKPQKPTISPNTSLSTADLNKQFGSKRAKRQTEQRERMQLDIENVREQLEQTVADIRIDPQDTIVTSVNETDSSYQPPINRDAATVEQVYDLEEIVSYTVLESLSEEADRVLESKQEDLGTTAFVTQEIMRLRKSSSGDRERACQILLYVDSLIKFTIATAKTVTTKKFQSCPYSEIASKDILMKFTVQSKQGRLRPNIMKDKCLCYILVLSMIACGYKINLDVVAKELKMGLRKLQDVSRILAFSVSKEIAMLKLPLPPPVSINRSKGKKRN